MAAASNGKWSVPLSGDANGSLYVISIRRANNREGKSIEGAVPHPASIVVLRVIPPDHGPAHA